MIEKNFSVEQLASKETRFVNFIIDWFIVIIVLRYFGIDEHGKSIYIFTYLLYCTLFEWFTNSKTIGKYVTKSRAIKDNGSSIEFKEAFFRSLIRIIPLEPWVCLSADYGYGWHDKWTNTIVIPEFTN